MKLRVAILGSGNIGTDLLIKTLRSSVLECALFVGRHADSPGLIRAGSLGVNVSDRGIDKLLEEPRNYDLVFDATNAIDHKRHWPLLKDLGKTVIDLTPSRVGKMHVPAVDERTSLDHQNVNMVSCGGQASVPLAYLIGKTQKNVEYIEVVSSIASRSAGHGTRINIDEYVETTEEAIRAYSGCGRAKTILILTPAKPDVNMQVTVSAK
ncbi:MAG: acetaldehyde dehydrogenase (acetylating), partial [Candidatus Omnitrophica bacterium]|nr:acetaldehyde dehydrogenase (acetylating) [Candidatus Omnitrophota bacterium]